MLKRLSPRERYEALIAEFEPILREIFLAAVADLRSGIALRVVIERLERQDIEGAMDALNLDRSAYSPLDEAIARAYSGGGRATVDAMPTLRDPNGAQAVIRFDAQAYRAVQWLRDHSLSEQMVRIDKDVARSVIADGLARGRGARRIGLDIAGRINRATGRREGGIIGLSEPQAQHVLSMRERLASGDADEMAKVFTMKRRNRRFDRTIQKAINEGRAVKAEDIDRMAARYSDRLLQLRAETIAQDQGMAAFNAAQIEAYEQAIDRGVVDAATLQKTWRTNLDGRERFSHRQMNKQTVGFREGFQSPSGAVLKHPHDPDAPAEERIRCHCRMDITIDFLARFRRRG